MARWMSILLGTPTMFFIEGLSRKADSLVMIGSTTLRESFLRQLGQVGLRQRGQHVSLLVERRSVLGFELLYGPIEMIVVLLGLFYPFADAPERLTTTEQESVRA